MNRIGRWSPYPAQDALIKTGERCAPRVLGRLEAEDDEGVRRLLGGVVASIDGKEMAALRLRKRMASSHDGGATRRLDSIVKWIEAAP